MLRELHSRAHKEVIEKSNDILRLELKLKELPDNPILANLMRANLGLVPIDFTNIDEEGLPPHFLSTASKDTREMYITQLAQIQQLEVWDAMCKFHIDTQGNFSFRQADGELQMLAGRMSVNGISLLKNEVRKGFEEYTEGRKPPEEFDEFELGEGVIIKKDN